MKGEHRSLPDERQEPPPARDVISDRTATGIIWTVMAMWSINLLLGMFGPELGLEYTPSETVNGIFMAVVGGTFIARARARGGSGE